MTESTLTKPEATELTTTEKTPPLPQRTPHVDVRRRDSGWTVTADLPGARREDLEILLERDVLTLTAPIQAEAPEGYRRIHGELARAQWKRSFRLPSEVDGDKLEARLADGVLTLEIPRTSPRERRIEVQVADPAGDA